MNIYLFYYLYYQFFFYFCFFLFKLALGSRQKPTAVQIETWVVGVGYEYIFLIFNLNGPDRCQKICQNFNLNPRVRIRSWQRNPTQHNCSPTCTLKNEDSCLGTSWWMYACQGVRSRLVPNPNQTRLIGSGLTPRK